MSEQPDEEVLWVGSKEWVRQEEDRKANEAAMAIKALNPLVAPVERPELPALDVTEKRRPQYVMFDPPLPNDVQCRVPKDVCGGMYRAADADDIFEHLEAELLSAQSRIRKLEQNLGQKEDAIQILSRSWDIMRATADEQASRAEKAEAERDALQELLGMDERGVAAIKNILAERDQLKAELETALQQRDAAMTGQTERQSQFEKMGDLADEAIEQRNTAEAKLSRILAITETPEWFITPCARAVREVLEGK